MLVPTKPNEQRPHCDNGFTWEQFAKDCLLNKYALVIGSEAILNLDIFHEVEGDSMKLLFEKTLYHKAKLDLKDECSDNDRTISDECINEELQRLKKRYANFSQLDRKVKNVKDLAKQVSIDQQYYLSKNNININDDNIINPSLLALLRTKCFRIIITTDVNPFLEHAMKSVWGENGYDTVQLENSQETFKQDYDEFGVVRPILCYAFGKVNPQGHKYVLSENDAIEKIAKQFETKDNNSFLKFIRNYSIISIGPRFDDWMFRFFWFLLRGKIHSKLSEEEQSKDGLQIAVEINKENNAYDSLTNYLKKEKVEVFTGDDAKDFMGNAEKQIRLANQTLRITRKDQGVFISYSHKDKYIAMPLFKKLEFEGIPVWIDDEELDTGAEFDNRIKDALKCCKFFMPVLSTTIKEDISTDKIKDKWYYQNEWIHINNRYKEEEDKNNEIRKLEEHRRPKHSFKTIPFVVGDYNYTQDYHQLLPDCIKNASINDSFVLTKDNVKHLIEIIKKNE